MSATADKRVPVSGGKDVSFADRGVSTDKQRFTDSRQSVPRRLSAAKPHIFRAVSTENTKPQVLSAAVRPPDETFPEAARLTAAYNLQASRYRKVDSADYRFPHRSVNPRPLLTSNLQHLTSVLSNVDHALFLFR